MGNTNFQTIYPMGGIVNGMVKQATGREPVDNLDMDYVTVAQNTVVGELEFTGDVVQFQTGRSVPIRKLEVSLEPVQSGSGDPSPENVRPISGWDAVHIYKTGKNILKLNNIETPIPVTNGNLTITENSLITRTQTNAVGITTLISTSIVSDIYNEYFNPGTYWFGYEILTSDFSSTTIKPEFIYDDGTIVAPDFGSSIVLTKRAKLNRVITSYTMLPVSSVFTARIWMSLGSTATDYEPYTGETITTEFPTPPGTVYGGTLDVITGVLTVDRALVDLGQLTWAWNASNGWIAAFSGIEPMGNNNTPMDAIATNMRVVSKSESYSIVSSGTNEDTIAATWQGTYLYGSNANATPTGTLCYKLATPQTYQLTPQEVSTLVGDNTIYSDAGTVDVMYWVYREMS